MCYDAIRSYISVVFISLTLSFAFISSVFLGIWSFRMICFSTYDSRSFIQHMMDTIIQSLPLNWMQTVGNQATKIKADCFSSSWGSRVHFDDSSRFCLSGVDSKLTSSQLIITERQISAVDLAFESGADHLPCASLSRISNIRSRPIPDI